VRRIADRAGFELGIAAEPFRLERHFVSLTPTRTV
jgi:hypothetical protein